ncbi:RNA polymerase sigma factor [Oceanirhabdus seepicola]|uniref:RNA polymerase sigma factor n=1 Tax=Oceanirhabdus seepicola TaxID=2828781 RepID=A0A9J6P8L1_9CLOT|nr:RNA polymerase sigma factor [Oceanirhabdus seepicola]MCM1992249.1 RNA polymerase sigma factor [Oceanirhabdus seepicola]
MPQSDNQLVEEIISGNESAMEVLVKRHYDMVYSFICRYVGEYNIACDLTQDTFIKVMKNIGKYNHKHGEFRSWILKIAVNTSKDYFKSSAYKQRNQSDDVDNCHLKSSDDVIHLLDKKQERKEIKQAVDELPTLQREAIILKYFHDLKIREISKMTGEKEATIKSRIFSGIKNLKKRLGGEGEDEKRRIAR